ncbi:MAG: hypothetical protein AABX71_01480, partial [Nanoarchaeota archaeon]
RNWILGDRARKGVNIKRLGILTEEELRIWNDAVPYQDQRNDPGHGEMTAYFAIKLLKYLPGEHRVAVPAAILHDTGWYGDDPEAWKKLVEASKDNLQALDSEANRRPHQNRGILIAGRVLERGGYFDTYPFANWLEIADIIGDHDTRKLPTTVNGRIVRVADLLWRVTYPHAEIYMADKPPEEILSRVKETCLSEPFLSHLGDIGTQIARIEFANMIHFKFREKAKEALEKDYGKELERIVQFYQ